jgi:hypothetical protein
MSEFRFSISEVVLYKNELFIVVGKAMYISGDILYLLQPYNVNNPTHYLDFTKCTWANENKIKLYTYEEENKSEKE